MRLTCPNCGAQYEVPDDVIPAEGRDVQCSNCGTTWFQPQADAMAQDTEAPHPLEPLDDEAEAALPEADDALPDQAPVPPKPRRQELDPDVKDILQEEAEHEARLRAEDAAGLETQPDLGLDDTSDDAERRAREARVRMERLRGPESPAPQTEEAMAVAAAAAKSSRRDRLPDIDEINSSLRSTNAPAPTEPATDDPLREEPRRSSFARGFAIPIIIVTLLVLIYGNAPRLADTMPALGPALNGYVLAVDQLRAWLDSQLGALMP